MELITIVYEDHIINYQKTKSIIIEAAMKYEKMKPSSIKLNIDGKILPDNHLEEFLRDYLGTEYDSFIIAMNNNQVLAFLQILYYMKCADESKQFQELLNEDAKNQ